MNKICTTIEQSKKLADILPIESADVYWWYSGKRYYVESESMDDNDYNSESDIPAWSLSALLDILPKYIGGDSVLRIDYSEDFGIWYDEIGCGVNNNLPDITMKSPIDACYEMILKLHELKML